MLVQQDRQRRQDEWEDIPDEGTAPAGSATKHKDQPIHQEGQLLDTRQQRASTRFRGDEHIVEGSPAAHLRDARNRYIDMEEHNRYFSDQADNVGGSDSKSQVANEAYPAMQPRRRSPRLNPDVQDTAIDPGATSTSVDQYLLDEIAACEAARQYAEADDPDTWSPEARAALRPKQHLPVEDTERPTLVADGEATETHLVDEAEEPEEGDEEVQIGPGPDDGMFDDEFRDEGGLILEGDVEGILDGTWARRSTRRRCHSADNRISVILQASV
jgi:hypothetical protein